jgi:phosphoglycerate dehydrogenase-like enzyme
VTNKNQPEAMSEKLPTLLLLAPTEGDIEEERLKDLAIVKHGLKFSEEENAWKLTDEDCKEAIGISLSHLGRVEKALLERCPKLRVVARHGTGVDNIDIAAATELNICVCNVPDYGIEEVADSAMAHILGLFRQTTFLYEGLRQGKPLGTYDQLMAATTASRRIRGKTLGLFGLGNIGMAVAQRAKAFGFDILVYDPYLHDGLEKGVGGVERVYEPETLIARSDCVSLHCPLTKDNHHIINAEALKHFKKEAFLVNVSRGGLIDEVALADALKSGRLAGAALDVQEHEPFKLAGSVLEDAPNLICTPHAGWCSQESVVDARVGGVKAFLYAITRTDKPQGIKNCLNARQLDWEKVKARWNQ